jgi:putative transposase
MGRLTHRTVPSCTYFVTAKSWQNRAVFQSEEIARIIASKILHYRGEGAYRLHEFVLMPNHLHLLITPGPTTSLEKAMQLVKGGSSYEIHRALRSRIEIWQPGFHDWTIRNAEDYAAKVLYIRMNPVEAKLVQRPEEWAFGSASGSYETDPPPERFRG